MEKRLRIAVQSKGRLYDETMALFAEAGIKLTAVKRTLLVPSRNFPVEFLFLRDDDIPGTVADGTADLGIVGLNEVLEKCSDVDVVKELGFSRCRLSLAIPQHIEYNGLEWFNGRRIATSYPIILRNFLNENGIRADIHVISGSVEIAPGIGLADAIFDIVSSGSTLVSNNLEEVYSVIESQAVLIKGAGATLPDDKAAILDELLFRFEAVKAAEGRKYILMNVPRQKLDEVLAILPGMKSPTVLPLANADWCSVHSVLDEKMFWQIVSRLKAAGAEGILALDIEKMIL
ncbi:ATP phosphoribosyltransferase [Muribaculum sp.]|uniref:ATP phosphoribosyltransferase n=1 Tax=Muribaculum sp. TaxID=1918611 RepID=UPI0023D4AFF9|nr:ATP phosphoribosyltransferase [Muribaculum sp.]MDE5705654.1 ATP phosphoribosyltransferase [Muribaculum sp.]